MHHPPGLHHPDAETSGVSDAKVLYLMMRIALCHGSLIVQVRKKLHTIALLKGFLEVLEQPCLCAASLAYSKPAAARKTGGVGFADAGAASALQVGFKAA